MPNEADDLKNQIANGGRSLELWYQTTALDVESANLRRMYCEKAPPV